MHLIPILAILACAAPAGYLAGRVYCHKNNFDEDILPWFCAAFAPLAMVLAVTVLTQAETEKTQEKNQ